MEVTLEEIIDAIEQADALELKNLLEHYSQVNEYFEIDDGLNCKKKLSLYFRY